MFLFTFNKFLYYITMSMERVRGSNKLLYKEATPRSEPYQPYRVLLTGKANVALLHLISWINNELRFKFLSC